MTHTATAAGRSPDDGGQASRERKDGQKPGSAAKRAARNVPPFLKRARSGRRAAASPAAQPKASSPRRPWSGCAGAVVGPEPALRERSALRAYSRPSQALYSDRGVSS